MRGASGLLWLGALVLIGCGPTPGSQLGDGMLVVDEARYPGEAGPLVGEIATTQDEADVLWGTLGLPGRPPDLGANALVTLSGGDREDCPWRLGDVTVDAAQVVLALRPNGWFTRLRAGGDCDGGWSPRTVAFTVPVDAVDRDTEVAVDLPWDHATIRPTTVRSIEERPDPTLWSERTLSTDDLGDPWGCEGWYVVASTPGATVRLMIDWSQTADRQVTDGFGVSGPLPMDGTVVSIVTGSGVTADLCSDIDFEHRPLIAGRWVATSGHLDVEVREEDRSGYLHPLATVVLRDATFEPVDPSDGAPWYVEEVRFDEAPIGGFAG